MSGSPIMCARWSKVTREWREASPLMRAAFVLEWVAFIAFAVMIVTLSGVI